jgi:hypothetical protein
VSSHIRQDLLGAVRTKQCVLFVGAGLSRPAGLLSAWELGKKLAEQIGYPRPNDPLRKVAQRYRWIRGKSALVQFLVGEIRDRNPKPTQAHQIIARLAKGGYFKQIFTTNYDCLIEDALKEVDCPRHVSKTDKQLGLAGNRVHVIKLHGCIEDDETLVITEDQYRDFFHKRPTLSKILGACLAQNPFLFLGYGLEDPDFDQVYHEIARSLGDLQRRSYAIQLKPKDWDEGDWERFHVDVWKAREIEVILRDATDFLGELEQHLGLYPLVSPVPYELSSGLADYRPEFDLFRQIVGQGKEGERILILCSSSGQNKSNLLREMESWCTHMSVSHALVDLREESGFWHTYQNLSSLFEYVSERIKSQFGDGCLASFIRTRDYCKDAAKEYSVGLRRKPEREREELLELRRFKDIEWISGSLITDLRALSHRRGMPFVLLINAIRELPEWTEGKREREAIRGWLYRYVLNGIRQRVPGHDFVVVIADIADEPEFDFGESEAEGNEWKGVVLHTSECSLSFRGNGREDDNAGRYG